AIGAKVPHDVRQHYVNLFVEEFLKSFVTFFQRVHFNALGSGRRKNVYDRSINKLKYQSIAVNALKRLKSQNILPAKGASVMFMHVHLFKLQPLLFTALHTPIRSPSLYVLTAPSERDQHENSMVTALKRICCRCGATFSVDKSGKHTRRQECNYHFGKVIENRVPGGIEIRYSCCENAVGSPGCQVFNLHVHDAVSLQGIVNGLPQSSVAKTCPGCYTTQGLELARVTVVNSSLQVVIDSFVKPDNDVVEYNTWFSGISEGDVKGTKSSLRDVQAVLLSFINADTILIGHGLEIAFWSFCHLQIIHSTVIDSSVVFAQRLGLLHKRELNSLTADYLRRIIQEMVGHDTLEDAAACMELMLWRVKEDSKVKRW
uniref:Exonuclease domain-containing protein n=1 Tax=Cyprinus carpio carpio TaxID=630221 RepID=A0A9J7YJZ3_CYPCA